MLLQTSAFANLGNSIETIKLIGNQLKGIQVDFSRGVYRIVSQGGGGEFNPFFTLTSIATTGSISAGRDEGGGGGGAEDSVST